MFKMHRPFLLQMRCNKVKNNHMLLIHWYISTDI